MKNKLKDIKVKLPIILSFRDYHEIDNVLYHINSLLRGKIKANELGCSGEYYEYYAIFYLKKDKEYYSLVKEWQSSYEEEFDDEG